jgi:hypothetical protein
VVANTDESIVQICSSCKKDFPATAEHFHRSKIGKHGLMAVCKVCQSNIQKAKNNPANDDPRITKRCSKCGLDLPATLNFFHREKAGFYGVRSICKRCICKRNEEKRKTPSVAKHRRNYDKKRRSTKEYREYNKKYAANRRKDTKNTLTNRISCGIRSSIKSGSKGGRHWENLLGFTVDELKRHIEKNFCQGMSWDNFGEWHIDHKIPISAFNFETPEHVDFLRCWSLDNLQPMWAKDNIAKSNKLTEHFQPNLPLSMGGQ